MDYIEKTLREMLGAPTNSYDLGNGGRVMAFNLGQGSEDSEDYKRAANKLAEQIKDNKRRRVKKLEFPRGADAKPRVNNITLDLPLPEGEDIKNIQEQIHPIELPEDFLKKITKYATKADKPEMVNHPNHYNDYDVECIEMMRRIWGDEAVATWCKLNAFKYRCRMGLKQDNDLTQDLEKEQWYLKKYHELNK